LRRQFHQLRKQFHQLRKQFRSAKKQSNVWYIPFANKNPILTDIVKMGFTFSSLRLVRNRVVVVLKGIKYKSIRYFSCLLYANVTYFIQFKNNNIFLSRQPLLVN
jgi:hypothetical protein